MNKKLKLSKLTISNLDRVKAGKPILLCYCNMLNTDGAQNRDNHTAKTYCYPGCDSVAYCYTEPDTCTEYHTIFCQ